MRYAPETRRNPPLPPRTCDECGGTYVPRHSQTRFCTPACAAIGHRTKQTCRACGSIYLGGKGRRYCDKHRDEGHTRRQQQARLMSLERRLRRAMERLPKPCLHCGRLSATSYCSRVCVGLGTMQTYGERRCVECDRPFVARVAMQRYCGATCASRVQRGMRDARKRRVEREPIFRAYVFKRDRYCCHLCGDRLAMNESVPHPLAPTIDHVVPLADGGSHTHANVRAAHYRCNCVKGARGGGEQLALVG